MIWLHPLFPQFSLGIFLLLINQHTYDFYLKIMIVIDEFVLTKID